MKTSGRKFVSAIVASGMLLIPTAAHACSVCMGDPTSKQAGAINAAIFLMLGFIGAMLASLCGFGYYLAKRSKLQTPADVGFAPGFVGGEEPER